MLHIPKLKKYQTEQIDCAISNTWNYYGVNSLKIPKFVHCLLITINLYSKNENGSSPSSSALTFFNIEPKETLSQRSKASKEVKFGLG